MRATPSAGSRRGHRLADNVASINLLVKLGFYFDRMVLMPGDKTEVKLFARQLGPESD